MGENNEETAECETGRNELRSPELEALPAAIFICIITNTIGLLNMYVVFTVNKSNFS